MATPIRHNQAGCDYHVYNRGPNGEPIYLDDLDRRAFLRALVWAASSHPVEVLAFCLMGNHYHLMIRCIEACLGAFMRDFTSAYVCYFNERHEVEGRLCRDRFQSKYVDSKAYFRALNLYVHRNPKDLGFEGRLAEYPWSSLGYYFSPDNAPWWLNPDPALREFGGAANYASRIDTAAVLALQSDAGPDELYEAWAVREVDAIIAAVAGASGLEPEELLAGDRSHRQHRGVALLLARERTDLPLSSLAARLGWACSSSVRNSIVRYREMMSSDQDLSELFRAARSSLDL